MRIIRRLTNMPLILVLSIKIKWLTVGVNAADALLYEACETGCDKCEAERGCESVQSCPVTTHANRLERLLLSLKTETDRLQSLKG